MDRIIKTLQSAIEMLEELETERQEQKKQHREMIESITKMKQDIAEIKDAII